MHSQNQEAHRRKQQPYRIPLNSALLQTNKHNLGPGCSSSTRQCLRTLAGHRNLHFHCTKLQTQNPKRPKPVSIAQHTDMRTSSQLRRENFLITARRIRSFQNLFPNLCKHDSLAQTSSTRKATLCTRPRIIEKTNVLTQNTTRRQTCTDVGRERRRAEISNSRTQTPVTIAGAAPAQTYTHTYTHQESPNLWSAMMRNLRFLQQSWPQFKFLAHLAQSLIRTS